MKRRIFFSSMLAVVLLILIPSTHAIRIQDVEKERSSALPLCQMMKTTDPETIRGFLRTLIKNNLEVSGQLEQWIKEIDKTSAASSVKDSFGILSSRNIKGPQLASDNQSLLEKIYWKVFNYRLFRLLVSGLIYYYHPSKLTLLRVTTWGIKLLRLIQLGVLLGFIPSTPQPPQPAINFVQDPVNKTLTVASVSPSTILWSDIDQIGSGHCDPLPNGTIMVGDKITNCSGFIILRYIPLNQILGIFEFD